MDSLATFWRPTALYLNSTLSAFTFEFRIFRNIQSVDFLSWNVEIGNKVLGCNPKKIQQRKGTKLFWKYGIHSLERDKESWFAQPLMICEVLIISDYRNVPVVYTKTGRQYRTKKMILTLFNLQRLRAPMARLSLLQEAKSDAINRTFLSRI